MGFKILNRDRLLCFFFWVHLLFRLQYYFQEYTWRTTVKNNLYSLTIKYCLCVRYVRFCMRWLPREPLISLTIKYLLLNIGINPSHFIKRNLRVIKKHQQAGQNLDYLHKRNWFILISYKVSRRRNPFPNKLFNIKLELI